LAGRDGAARVLALAPRNRLETVYAIEVDGDHVYRVGELCLLVHNLSLAESLAIIVLSAGAVGAAAVMASAFGIGIGVTGSSTLVLAPAGALGAAGAQAFAILAATLGAAYLLLHQTTTSPTTTTGTGTGGGGGTSGGAGGGGGGGISTEELMRIARIIKLSVVGSGIGGGIAAQHPEWWRQEQRAKEDQRGKGVRNQ